MQLRYEVLFRGEKCVVVDRERPETQVEFEGTLAAWTTDGDLFSTVQRNDDGRLLVWTYPSPTISDGTRVGSADDVGDWLIAEFSNSSTKEQSGSSSIAVLPKGAFAERPVMLAYQHPSFWDWSDQCERLVVTVGYFNIFTWSKSDPVFRLLAKLDDAGFLSLTYSRAYWSGCCNWIIVIWSGHYPIGMLPPAPENLYTWLMEHLDYTLFSVCVLNAATGSIVTRFFMDEYYYHDWEEDHWVIGCVKVYGNQRVTRRKYMVYPATGFIDVDNMIEFIPTSD